MSIGLPWLYCALIIWTLVLRFVELRCTWVAGIRGHSFLQPGAGHFFNNRDWTSSKLGDHTQQGTVMANVKRLHVEIHYKAAGDIVAA